MEALQDGGGTAGNACTTIHRHAVGLAGKGPQKWLSLVRGFQKAVEYTSFHIPPSPPSTKKKSINKLQVTIWEVQGLHTDQKMFLTALKSVAKGSSLPASPSRPVCVAWVVEMVVVAGMGGASGTVLSAGPTPQKHVRFLLPLLPSRKWMWQLQPLWNHTMILKTKPQLPMGKQDGTVWVTMKLWNWPPSARLANSRSCHLGGGKLLPSGNDWGLRLLLLNGRLRSPWAEGEGRGKECSVRFSGTPE